MGKFSLQRLLDIRKRKEEGLALELAAARSVEVQAQAQVAALRNLRDGAVNTPSAGGGRVLVGQLQHASLMAESLDRQLEEANEAVRAAERKVRAQLADFKEAMQERRVIDRLKEKHQAEEAAELIRLDQSAMDSIALTRFGRKRNQEQEGGM